MSAGQARRAPGEVIMGAAIGLTLEQISPFLTSLRNTRYRGDVVLFAHRRLERALRAGRLFDRLHVVRAQQWPAFQVGLLERPRARRLGWRPLQALAWSAMRLIGRLPVGERRRGALEGVLAAFVYTPMDTRFLRFGSLLASSAYRRVLVTDVRDVVFQSDPFEQLPEHGLAVGLETGSYTVGTEPLNALWMRRVYGEAMLARLSDRRVSCVGVTYGDREAMSGYLTQMRSELLSLTPAAAGIGGADTAIHNMLLWTGRLDPVHLLEPLRSPLATLNAVPETEVALSSEGRLLNLDGSEPGVLHQYDRLPGVAGRIRRAVTSGSSTRLE
jgi:hypothetical protein